MVDAIRSRQATFNQTIRNAVNRVRNQVGDTRIRLVDLAGLNPHNTITCGDDGRPEPYVNAIRLAFDFDLLSTATFHPNEAGQDAFSADFSAFVPLAVPFSVIDPAFDGANPNPAPRSVPFGTPVDIQLRAVGGTGDVTWAMTAGALPVGVTFDANTGHLGGEALQEGGFPATFTATAGGVSDSVTIPLTVTSIAPCTKVWGAAGGGDWHTATNWRPSGVPGPGDYACIDGSGSLTVTVSQPVTVATLRVRDVRTFTVSSHLTITSGTSHLEGLTGGGRVEPAAGTTLALADSPYTNQAIGNQIQGAGTTVVAPGSYLFADGLTLATPLVNQGTIRVQGGCSSGRGLILNSAFTNEGSLEVDGCIHSSTAPAPTFVNAPSGTLTPTSNFAVQMPFQNLGRIVIPRPATVQLQDANLTNGIWAGGGTLALADSSTIAGADLTGLATLRLTGTLTASGATTLPHSTELNSGTLARTGSGSFTVPAGAILTQASCCSPKVHAPLTNNGTILLSSDNYGPVYLETPDGLLTNNGLITSVDNRDGRIDAVNNAPGVVNSATGNVSAPTGRTLYFYSPLTNNGTIDVGPGTVLVGEPLTLGSTSVLRVSVGPSFSGTLQHPSGPLGLSGTLDIDTADGYEPGPGTALVVATASGPVTGSFGTVTGASITGSSLRWRPSISGVELRLLVGPNASGDYDGDRTTDIAVYRPSVGGWYRNGAPTTFFGLSGDIPVPGDYDGDGTTDIAVYRPSVGGWYRNGAPTTFFGLSGDIPVPGDYDGDGTTDIAVYRPSVGGWYRNGAPTTFFGASGDVPLPLPAAIRLSASP